MDQPQYILNQINQGIKMGMDSISNVSEKVQDSRLKDELLFQYDKYNEILNEVNDELTNYDDFPKDLNPMQKVFEINETGGEYEHTLNTSELAEHSHICREMLAGYTEWPQKTVPKWTYYVKNYLDIRDFKS